MSEVTILGLCSDNLVSIIQPSSTVECAFGTGNGCCGSDVIPFQSSYQTSGQIIGSSINIPVPMNLSTSAAIVSGNVLLVINGVVGVVSPPPNIQLQNSITNWATTVFIPPGTYTNFTVAVPYSYTSVVDTVSISISTSGVPLINYLNRYTVLTL